MIGSLERLTLRQLGTRRLRAALTCFGIVLGVGMVFGVLLLTGTIRSTFDDLIDSAFSKTDLVVSPTAGGQLSQDSVERIRNTTGVRDAGGAVGGLLTRIDENGEAVEGPKGTMYTAGYDAQHVRPYDFRLSAGREPRGGNELWVERRWADERGLGVGDTIPVMAPSGRAELHVVGLFEFGGGLSFGGYGLAGMALPSARPLFEQPEGWMTVSVVVDDPDEVATVQKRILARFGDSVDVDTPSALSDEIATQLEELNVTLYFFSGVALFVGAFLILNAFNMTVLQRMREIGTLRTLGADRRDVVRTVLAEAGALGVVGTVLGMGLGLGLALALMAAMRAFEVPVGDLAVEPSAVVLAIVLGLIVTLAGAAWPARRAAGVPPIAAVLGRAEVRVRQPWRRRAVLAVVLFLPGLLLGGKFWFASDSADSGLGAALGIVMTMAMFAGLVAAAPFVITPLVRLLGIPLRRAFPTAGRLAADATRLNAARTAATAVALTVGLSVIVVNSAMSTSFQSAIDRTLETNFARDLTVRPVGTDLADGGAKTVPARLRARLESLPDAGTVTGVRSVVIDMPGTDGHAGWVFGVDPARYARVDRTPISGPPDLGAAMRGLDEGGVVLGATYAESQDLKAGDRLRLEGPRGSVEVPVVGTLDDVGQYGGDIIEVSHETIERVYGVTSDAEIAMVARSAERRAPLEADVQRLLQDEYPGIEAQSTADVRDQVQTDVNRQFALFNGIVGIAVIVSLLGVVNTLAMSVVERTREIGVVRALGAPRWLVRVTMVNEGVLMTVGGAAAGIAAGTLIAWVWIQSADALLPGLTFVFPWATAILVTLAAVIFGVIAAALPARRAARLDPVRAIAYE